MVFEAGHRLVLDIEAHDGAGSSVFLLAGREAILFSLTHSTTVARVFFHAISPIEIHRYTGRETLYQHVASS